LLSSRNWDVPVRPPLSLTKVRTLFFFRSSLQTNCSPLLLPLGRSSLIVLVLSWDCLFPVFCLSPSRRRTVWESYIHDFGVVEALFFKPYFSLFQSMLLCLSIQAPLPFLRLYFPLLNPRGLPEWAPLTVSTVFLSPFPPSFLLLNFPFTPRRSFFFLVVPLPECWPIGCSELGRRTSNGPCAYVFFEQIRRQILFSLLFLLRRRFGVNSFPYFPFHPPFLKSHPLVHSRRPFGTNCFSFSRIIFTA